MPNILPFFVMTDSQAANFRQETTGDQNRLDPRYIVAGPYKGKYALPQRVLFDPAFAARRDAFLMLTRVDAFDIDAAWPSEPEE